MARIISQKELRKLQLLELDMLKEVKRICEKHNIEFFLIGGSLIGAVRHKGFIPWDDDIDIAMTRINYERFCKIAPSELPEKYFFQDYRTDKQCRDYHLARIRLEGTLLRRRIDPDGLKHQGFFIDIFPFDNISDSFVNGYIYFILFRILFKVSMLRKNYKFFPNSLVNNIISYILYLIFLPLKEKRLDNLLSNYHAKYLDKNNSKYVVLLRGSWGFPKERHLRENISDTAYLKFEDTEMPVPKKYHEYLTEQYGNYMTLPPEKDREIRHAYKIDFGVYK